MFIYEDIVNIFRYNKINLINYLINIQSNFNKKIVQNSELSLIFTEFTTLSLLTHFFIDMETIQSMYILYLIDIYFINFVADLEHVSYHIIEVWQHE